MKLDSGECYIIVSDDTRKVYLWIGLKSSVRSRFIASKRVQETRDRVGMHYGIIQLDEGQEDPEFLKLIGDSDKEGPDNDGLSSFPFIPPSPPGPTGTIEKKVHPSDIEEEMKHQLYCKHCGADLPKGESIYHVCEKKVI